MDPTETLIMEPLGDDEAQNEELLPRQTLLSVMDGFEKGKPSRCWYVSGNHLSRAPFSGLYAVKTFVLAHTQGEFHVGHLGYLDGSLTFMRVQSFKKLSRLQETYPQLFELTGHSYDF